MSVHATRYRSHTSTEIATTEPGTNVKLCGRILSAPRGKDAVFVFRDSFGEVEVSVAERDDLAEIVRGALAETVAQIDGVVVQAPAEDTQGKKGSAGEGGARRRVQATRVEVLSGANALPIPIRDAKATARLPVADRLRYRYLDLRRSELQERFRRRGKLVHAVRTHLAEQGFVELETPALTAWSEDATTSFVVAARDARAFALAETPQLYKQLLMAGDIDRYFQIAKCFRNEVRFGPWHQPEFTVLDFEMAYAEALDVYERVDELLAHVLEALWGVRIEVPIKRLTYAEAMHEYGTDRPDLRVDLPFHDVTSILRGASGPFFESALVGKGKGSGSVRAAVLRAGTLPDASDPALGELVAGVRGQPAEVRAVRVGAGAKIEGPVAKGISKAIGERLAERLGLRQGDVVVLVAHSLASHVEATIGPVRTHVATRLGMLDPEAPPSLVWIVDIPYFGYSPEHRAWRPIRHPFTQPVAEDRELLKQAGTLRRRAPQGESEGALELDRGKDFGAGVIFEDDPPERRELAKVRSKSFELVFNGEELLTGSVRNHELRVQERVFAMFGFDREEVERRYGPLMEAFRYGLPPHAGASLGLDRLFARMEKVEDLVEVIPFPKDHDGKEPLTGAPSEIDKAFLAALFGA